MVRSLQETVPVRVRSGLGVFSLCAVVSANIFSARVLLPRRLNYVLDFVVCLTMITTVNKKALMICRGRGTAIIIIVCCSKGDERIRPK